jgi:hypothetical protein
MSVWAMIKQLLCKHKLEFLDNVYLPCKYDGFIKKYRKYRCKKCGKIILHGPSGFM